MTEKELIVKLAIKLCNFALALEGGQLEGTQLECEREAKELLDIVKQANYVRFKEQIEKLPNIYRHTQYEGSYQAEADLRSEGFEYFRREIKEQLR